MCPKRKKTSPIMNAVDDDLYSSATSPNALNIKPLLIPLLNLLFGERESNKPAEMLKTTTGIAFRNIPNGKPNSM